MIRLARASWLNASQALFGYFETFANTGVICDRNPGVACSLHDTDRICLKDVASAAAQAAILTPE